MLEIWKDLEGFSEYEVSNLGKIRRKETLRVRKPVIDKGGYEMYRLKNDDGAFKTVLAHRAVAKAFIPNPENLYTVNHKDENKRNNCVDNLEWMSLVDNMNYGGGRKRHGESLKRNKSVYGGKHGMAKRVHCNELNKTYDCIEDAARELGIPSLSSHLRSHIKGKRRICGVYNGVELTWRYVDNNEQ